MIFIRSRNLLESFFIIGAVSITVLGGGLSGCSKPASPVTPPRVANTDPSPPVSKDPEDTHESTPVADSIEKLLRKDAANDKVFPAGLTIRKVTLKGGIASIDFSREFSSLANSGETTESMAQKALRKTLSQFSSIEKMRVTVEGKSFDSQATDWNEPFPVRDAKFQKSNDNGQKKSESDVL